ncbi:uncharacterized protein LAJ45_07828 [Morchella importuna]|uniref:uncharacterized protein n=1 Tax=Morchella importuna TaxID=1174673 RepID=UPI001E8EDD25|nr:uncharacterized protein LAJ45_07828 [Morchella importuna]KAH8148064.1 hypothetical protein LAJ45_07828 [Morchella importuna]
MTSSRAAGWSAVPIHGEKEGNPTQSQTTITPPPKPSLQDPGNQKKKEREKKKKGMETSKRPLLLHEAATPYVLLWTALMIPNRLLAATLILPLLALSYHNLLQTTSPNPPNSFLVGSFVVYHAFASINLLLLRDPRTEFRRLPITATGETKHQNGEEEEGEAYPRDLKRRIWWVFDLAVTMRGIGWSWQIRPIPPLSATEAASRHTYLRRRLARLLIIYAWIDLSMFVIQHIDRAYFLPPGNAHEYPPAGEPPVYPHLFSRSTRPQHHPAPLGLPPIPSLSSGAPALLYRAALYTARQIFTGIVMYAHLNSGYTFLSLSAVLLGALVGAETGWRRRYLHWHAWPDVFGRWSAGDWGRGLAGWWGGAWHGLFKNVFMAPGRFVVSRLGLGQRLPAAAVWVVRLVGPFVVSAALHYAGAWTQARGGWGSARFFLWQPVGVVVEAAVVRWCPGWVCRGWVRRWAPYVWVVVWLVVTSGSFFEELRYGGVWALQPVPVSAWKWAAGVGALCGGETAVGWWEWDDGSLGGWGVRI